MPNEVQTKQEGDIEVDHVRRDVNRALHEHRHFDFRFSDRVVPLISEEIPAVDESVN